MSSPHRPLRQHLNRKDVVVLGIAGLILIACGIGGGPGPNDPVPPTEPSQSDDAGSIATVDAGPICQSSWGLGTVSGILRTSVHDINFEGAAAKAQGMHKRDVDPIEDGCVTRAILEVQGPCYLSLMFETRAGYQDLVLTKGGLGIGSDCPGWLDAEEGGWTLIAETPTDDGGTVLNAGRLTPPAEIDGNKDGACVDVDLQPTGEVTFKSETNRPDLRFNLNTLRYRGAAWSWGNPAAACPGP